MNDKSLVPVPPRRGWHLFTPGKRYAGFRSPCGHYRVYKNRYGWAGQHIPTANGTDNVTAYSDSRQEAISACRIDAYDRWAGLCNAAGWPVSPA